MSSIDPTEVFRQEASELFETLEAALLDLGQRPDDRELVDSAFRALHTIKGSGAMFGFDKVAAFTHEFETAFELVRKGEIRPTHELISVALAAKDYIRALIEAPESTDSIIGDAILDDLRQFVAPGALPIRITPNVETPAAGERPALGWQLHLEFDFNILCNGSNPLDLLDDLCKLGSCFAVPVTDDVPLIEELEPEYCYLKWNVTLHSDCDKAAIDDVFMFVQDEMKLTLAPLTQAELPRALPLLQEASPAIAPVEPAPPAMSEPAASAQPPAAKIEPRRDESKRDEPKRGEERGIATVRVQAGRLDELMDRVGELVIAQARLTQLAASGSDLSIKMIAEEIERLAASLRDTTMGARMVPIGSLFGRFRRLVHDLSRDLAKPVEFVTLGEDTELDKTMIECLADPLVHLIRNAIDHGIEDNATRAAAGKTEKGRIELRAVHSGAQVLVTVKDNGGGLNTARIRAKAEEQGLIVPGASLSDNEIHQLLFHPGFSTAQTISALSGRGVGMDVVKRTIENMRGSIDLATRPGQGTTVTLRLPLTLAIIEGLLIRVGQGRYIIPLSAVEECVELMPEDQRSRGRNFLNVRGNLVPFLKLRQLFQAAGSPEQHQKTIIISTGETRVGLADAVGVVSQGRSVYGGPGGDSSSFLLRIRQSLAQASGLIANCEGAGKSIDDALLVVDDTLGKFRDAIANLSEAVVDITLIGMNASLKAGHLGSKGNAFVVIANELKATADQVSGGAARLKPILDGIEESASHLRSLRIDDDPAQLAKLEPSILDALREVEAGNERFDRLIGRLVEEGVEFESLMNSAQRTVTELEASSATLPAVAARLETSGAIPDGFPPALGEDALLDELFAQYTMERERDVHRDVLQRFDLVSKSAALQPVSDSADDGVLLF